MPAALTDAERDEIIALIETGQSCGQIAKTVNRSRSTVSAIARAIGHTFGRTNLVRAQEARSAYTAERRAAIAARLTEEAELLLDQLHEPHTAFNFGGKDNDYAERVMPEPPVEAKRALIQATREAMRTVIDISRHDTKADQNNAAGLVVALVDGLRGGASGVD